MKNLLFLLPFLLFLSSCNKDDGGEVNSELPASEFSFEIIEHTEVKFSGTTTGNSYLWDFGDGTTSTQRNPSHTFAKSGEYSVKFSVETADGTRESTQNISVEIPINILISRLWVIESGTKNGAEYSEANGSKYTFWGDGTLMAGTLQFNWFFENNNQTIVIDYGPNYPQSKWALNELSLNAMDVSFTSNSGDNYTYHFIPGE